jgi:hypothetical protein
VKSRNLTANSGITTREDYMVDDDEFDNSGQAFEADIAAITDLPDEITEEEEED